MGALGVRWGHVWSANRCRNIAGVFPDSVRQYRMPKSVGATVTEYLEAHTSFQVPRELTY